MFAEKSLGAGPSTWLRAGRARVRRKNAPEAPKSGWGDVVGPHVTVVCSPSRYSRRAAPMLCQNPRTILSRLLGVATALLLVLTSCSGVPALEVITAGGDGPPTLVMLHGFGSSAEEWMPFTQTIEWPPPGRFVFPQGPATTGLPAAPVGGRRSWWPLELRAFISPGGGRRSGLSHQGPVGWTRAALRHASRRTGVAERLRSAPWATSLSCAWANRSRVAILGV